MLWQVKSNLLESLYHQFAVVLVLVFDIQGYFIMALAFVFYAKRCRDILQPVFMNGQASWDHLVSCDTHRIFYIR